MGRRGPEGHLRFVSVGGRFVQVVPYRLDGEPFYRVNEEDR